MRVVVFTPVAPDGILPLCLSQLYDVTPSASQVSEKLKLLVSNEKASPIGCSVINGGVTIEEIYNVTQIYFMCTLTTKYYS